MHFMFLIFTAPKQSLGQGNIFRNVRHSVHKGGSASQGGLPTGGLPKWGLPPGGLHPGDLPTGGLPKGGSA